MAIPIMNVSILNGSNGFRLDNNVDLNQGHTRLSVSNAGDINGDGFDDVMMGVFFSYSKFLKTEYTYVVFGKASGFSAVENLAQLNGDNGFRVIDESDSVAYKVSDSGDINGDGIDDMIIGAEGIYDYYANPRWYPGDAYVVFGRSSGFTADVNLSELDGSDGFLLEAGEAQSVSVSSAGDVNGDGLDDVIIAADGSGHIVFGKAARFDAVMELSSLDGKNGFRVEDEYSRLISVSNAGDINGDGYDDVIVSDHSSTYVVFGKASGFEEAMDVTMLDGNNGFRIDGSGRSFSHAGDFNGDGVDDVVIGNPESNKNGEDSGSAYVVFGRAKGFDATMDLSSLNGSNGFRVDGTDAFDELGISVSSAGDVNGDGFDDVIIGAPDAGASYVIFGSASGFDAVLDLTSLDGQSGFSLQGMGGFFGGSVSSAGDVNDDGVSDMVIGSDWDYSVGYVVFGGSFLNEAVYRGTSANDFLVGTILAERFEAGDGDDEIDSLGGADIIFGEAGDDTIEVVDLDFERVDGGIGSDILKLASGLNMNLAHFRDTLDGLETIDMTNLGGNSLTLTLPDLISLSDTANIFTVEGDPVDRVMGLNEGWKFAGIEGNYRIFTHGGTMLRVNVAVITDYRLGVINLADLNGSDGFRMDGVAEGDRLGYSVSDAGDVNGDGFDDVIVGARDADPNGLGSGSSYVLFGRASGFDAVFDLAGLDGANGFRLDGVARSDGLGHSVNSAGDVNGDGFDDLLIAAPGVDSNGRYSGSSYMVFGKASGFPAAQDLSHLDGRNGFRVDGLAAGDYLSKVSSAGDINGDGFDDLIVGARDADPNGLGSGSSYVVFGRASGFDAVFDLAGLDGANGFRLDGAAEYDRLGFSVSSAGDINGDGFDDVIVGASGADPSGNVNAGSSYVVFGRASGFDALMSLASLDGSNGFRMDGLAADDSLSAVSSAGDVNGDGFDDVIVGASGADPNGNADAGSSYVVFGKTTGFDATVDLSGLDGKNGFRMDGAAFNESGYSVSNAGDVNGDGFDDVIVSAFTTDPHARLATCFVVFGKASGFSAAMDLTSLDGKSGFRLDGASINRSPFGVSSAGDIDSDGFDDLIIGDPGSGIYSGSSYIVFGRSDFGGGQLPTIPGTSSDDVLRGTSAAEIFEAGDGNDVLSGGGGADVFRGGAGVDQIKVPDLNFESIDGGIGEDMLHLAGADLNLALTALGDHIQGIETICLYGRGDNSLSLTADSLLDLSDTSNTLKLHGNAGDRVTVQDGGWVDEGLRSGGYYHVYTNDDAVLLVGANVTVEFV